MAAGFSILINEILRQHETSPKASILTKTPDNPLTQTFVKILAEVFVRILAAIRAGVLKLSSILKMSYFFPSSDPYTGSDGSSAGSPGDSSAGSPAGSSAGSSAGGSAASTAATSAASFTSPLTARQRYGLGFPIGHIFAVYTSKRYHFCQVGHSNGGLASAGIEYMSFFREQRLRELFQESIKLYGVTAAGLCDGTPPNLHRAYYSNRAEFCREVARRALEPAQADGQSQAEPTDLTQSYEADWFRRHAEFVYLVDLDHEIMEVWAMHAHASLPAIQTRREYHFATPFRRCIAQWPLSGLPSNASLAQYGIAADVASATINELPTQATRFSTQSTRESLSSRTSGLFRADQQPPDRMQQGLPEDCQEVSVPDSPVALISDAAIRNASWFRLRRSDPPTARDLHASTGPERVFPLVLEDFAPPPDSQEEVPPSSNRRDAYILSHSKRFECVEKSIAIGTRDVVDRQTIAGDFMRVDCFGHCFDSRARGFIDEQRGLLILIDSDCGSQRNGWPHPGGQGLQAFAVARFACEFPVAYEWQCDALGLEQRGPLLGNPNPLFRPFYDYWYNHKSGKLVIRLPYAGQPLTLQRGFAEQMDLVHRCSVFLLDVPALVQRPTAGPPTPVLFQEHIGGCLHFGTGPWVAIITLRYLPGCSLKLQDQRFGKLSRRRAEADMRKHDVEGFRLPAWQRWFVQVWDLSGSDGPKILPIEGSGHTEATCATYTPPPSRTLAETAAQCPRCGQDPCTCATDKIFFVAAGGNQRSRLALCDVYTGGCWLVTEGTPHGLELMRGSTRPLEVEPEDKIRGYFSRGADGVDHFIIRKIKARGQETFEQLRHYDLLTMAESQGRWIR